MFRRKWDRGLEDTRTVGGKEGDNIRGTEISWRLSCHDDRRLAGDPEGFRGLKRGDIHLYPRQEFVMTSESLMRESSIYGGMILVNAL